MMRANIDTRNDEVVQPEVLSTAWLLTGGLAHEINNALVSLITCLSSLSELIPPDPASEARQELAGAQDAAQHIVTVVRNVQALLRSECPGALIDPRAAVERAIRLACRRARGVCSLRDELADVPFVRGSDTWLTQIALNLILNGIEACRAAAPRSGQVVVSLRRDRDAVALSVSDDGIGMDVERAKRIFRHIATRPPGASSGLGLAVTCRLITAMGGVMDLESQPGSGTAFRVRLPVAADMP